MKLDLNEKKNSNYSLFLFFKNNEWIIKLQQILISVLTSLKSVIQRPNSGCLYGWKEGQYPCQQRRAKISTVRMKIGPRVKWHKGGEQTPFFLPILIDQGPSIS